MSKRDQHPNLDKIMSTDLPDRAVARGVREAMVLHKKLGHPVASWEDGQVKWVPPEEIEVGPEIPPAIYEEDPTS